MSALSSSDVIIRLRQSLRRTISLVISKSDQAPIQRKPVLLKLSLSRLKTLWSFTSHGARPLQTQILVFSRGIAEIVEASTPNSERDTGKESNRRDRQDTSKDQNSAISENIFISLLTLAFAYATWINWDKVKRKASDSFKVEAAKPISEADESYASLGSRGNSLFGLVVGDGEKPKSRRQTNNEIADVVEMVGNAVVCIEIKDHSMLDWMSGVPRVVSNGSGFIIKEDGLILTNAHVVMGRQHSSLTIRLHDGRCFSGNVEDVDTQSDIATVRIHARGLPVMPLGSSSKTRIGEKVVAIGSPLSLSNSVTSGVVSCVSRTADELGIGTNINYIQTDASITFGNSGGPLVNLDGEAIGINSMKVAAGISFAIPIDYVKDFLAKVEANAKAGAKRAKTKRYIGFTLLTLTEDILVELPDFGWAKNIKGVLVWKIVVGSPAYLAGLQPGDIITKVNGQTVTTAGEIFKLLQTEATFTIQFRRYDKTYRCQLVPESITQG